MGVQVQTRAVRANDGTWALIVFSCPFCNRRHVFFGGSNDKPAQFGRRDVNCVAYSHECLILVPDGSEFAKVGVC